MKTTIGAAATAIALLVPTATYAAETTTIQLGQVGLSFYAVKGGVSTRTARARWLHR